MNQKRFFFQSLLLAQVIEEKKKWKAIIFRLLLLLALLTHICSARENHYFNKKIEKNKLFFRLLIFWRWLLLFHIELLQFWSDDDICAHDTRWNNTKFETRKKTHKEREKERKKWKITGIEMFFGVFHCIILLLLIWI